MRASAQRLAILWCACIILFMAFPAGADYYKYTDRKGTVCITNRLDAVPSAYRARMKVIKEERKPAPAEPTASMPPEQTPAGDPPKKEISPPLSKRRAWLPGVALAAGALAGFLLVRRLSRALSSPQLARLITLAFFVGVFTLGYKLYADHLVRQYFFIKTKVLGILAKSNQREMTETGENLPDRKPPVP